MTQNKAVEIVTIDNKKCIVVGSICQGKNIISCTAVKVELLSDYKGKLEPLLYDDRSNQGVDRRYYKAQLFKCKGKQYITDQNGSFKVISTSRGEQMQLF